MVPEIWSKANRIFLSFWTFLCPLSNPLTTQKIKHFEKKYSPPPPPPSSLEMSSFYTCVPNDTCVSFLKYGVQQTDESDNSDPTKKNTLPKNNKSESELVPVPCTGNQSKNN